MSDINLFQVLKERFKDNHISPTIYGYIIYLDNGTLRVFNYPESISEHKLVKFQPNGYGTRQGTWRIRDGKFDYGLYPANVNLFWNGGAPPHFNP